MSLNNTSPEARMIMERLSKPPTVTPGPLTSFVIFELRSHALNYFSVKMITDEAIKVNNAFGFFQDCFVQDWINTNRTSLASGSFDEFIDALKARFLPRNWDSTGRNHIFNMRLTQKTNFDNWVMLVKKMNLALKGTPSHFNDNELRGLLNSLIDEELHHRCSNRKINDIVNTVEIAGIEDKTSKTRVLWLTQKKLDT